MKATLAALLTSASFVPSAPTSNLVCGAYGDDEWDDLGSLQVAGPAFGYRQPMRAMPRSSGRPTVPRNYLIPQNPGVPARGLRLQPLGLTAVAFTATSGTGLNMTALPQRPFKAKRLLIDLARTGTSATGLVTVTSINMGSDNQLVGQNPLPVSGFGATAFDLNIEFAPVTPGIQVVIGVGISVLPTMTDRVDLAGGFWGTALS